MNRLQTVLFCVACAVPGVLYGWTRLSTDLRGPREAPVPIIVTSETTHRVTADMEAMSREQLDQAAPDFTTVASDGRRYNLMDLASRGPVVLVFIKDGCPCSEAAQPFFNRLHASYPRATLLGVIDVEAEAAETWARTFDVSYPLLLDPDKDLVQAYKVENSAYTIVVGPDGRIARHWPGFSGPMLRDLGLLLSGFLGVDDQPFDVAEAPSEMYSGCPYLV